MADELKPYLGGPRREGGQLVGVVADGDDLRVHVALKLGEGIFRLLCAPRGRGGHAEDLRALGGGALEVLLHDTVVGVVLAGVVALVDDDERDLETKRERKQRRG